MGSLSAHLRKPDDHATLEFHPECPLCAERLSGVLPSDAVVSARTQALMAAGVMALSAGTPSVALAAVPPDQEQEGMAAPEDAAPAPTISPGFDPGGGSTDLPVEAGPPPLPVASPDDEAAPVEDEAATDADGLVAEPGGGTGPIDARAQPVIDETPAPPAAPAAPESPMATPAPAAAPSPPQRADRSPADDGGPQTLTGRAAAPSSANVAGRQTLRERVSAPPPGHAQAGTTVSYVTTTVPAARTSPVSNSAPVARQDGARRGDRFHVVRPGESLWSIARDLIGNEASVAAVAREVNRLWELNSARIATGDPDLLIAGTRLVLR